MIKVWTDKQAAGIVDRYQSRGSTFLYDQGVASKAAVSITMPIRSPSWNTAVGLAPIFEMNLPEGALRERLRLAFAKATGSFDDVDLLAIVGRSQLGRIRYTAVGDGLDEGVPFQSVDEILSSRRSGELYRYLIEKFAKFSGVSGVQPKFLVRDQNSVFGTNEAERELSPSFRGATHIVKFWDPAEYPQLAANEFFCLRVAEECGLNVPPHRLAEDGGALVMERFDLQRDGNYFGFEDFCVLNGRRTDEKYRGSYETQIMRRFQQFSKSTAAMQESLRLFTLIALNCAIRNGDAHLKNFGMTYQDIEGEAHIAPVYDLVTTTAYVPDDKMALTLNGTTEWPSAKELIRFAEGRSLASRQDLLAIFQRIAEAQTRVAIEIENYCREHPAFEEIATRMLAQWVIGRDGLRFSRL